MALNKLRQGDIEVGAPIPWDALDAAGRLLLRQGAVIQSQEQLERLIEHGLFNDALTAAAHTQADEAGASGGAPERVQRDPVFVFEAMDAHRAQLQRLLLPQVAERDFMQLLLELARGLQQSCDIDSDAALASTSLSRVMPFSTRQACNAAVITEMMGRQLEWSPESRLMAVAAALTMNVALLTLQDALYHQRGPLEDAQKVTIRAHPAAAVATLERLGVTDSDWLSTVAQHHELLDGSGYPAALRGEAIMLPARIVAIADKYCAMISERGYRDGVSADVALRQLLTAHGPGMDTELAARLVRELGIYPPGTAVELSNGEIGVVVKRTQDARHPVVRAVLSSQSLPLRDFPKRLTSKPAYAVKAAAQRSRLGSQFDPAPLWHPTLVARDSAE